MAKKNNKSTEESLTVVSSEPVSSIEEKKDANETKEPEKDVTTSAKGEDTDATKTANDTTTDAEATTESDSQSKATVGKDSDKKEISGTDIKETISASDKKVGEKPQVKENSETGKAEADPAGEDAPAPPPRPVSPLTQIKQDLKDAFPNVEERLITTVLIASQGNADPAFNALLYFSDPTVEAEIPEPAPPAAVNKRLPSVPKNTLTDDELLARKLQHEFELEDKRRRAHHEDRERRRRRRQQSQTQEEDDSVDEFGQIKESFTQGLEEARTTLNGWVSGFAKKFQEPTDNATKSNESQQQNPKLFGALGGSSYTKPRKNNTFDEDPQIISNDLHSQINMRDNDENETAPSLPKRQGGNAAGQKSVQSDSYSDSNKKWQPLNSDVPVNSDAFLVTDSEDEDTGVANYDTKGTKQSS